MEPTETPTMYTQAAGRADRREPWLRVFVDGFAPNMTDDELTAIRDGLANNDHRILQGATTDPVPLLCVHDWPCNGSCPVAFAKLGTNPEATVGEVEARFAELCYGCDAILGRADCRHLLTWIDETPRDVMQRNLAAAIDGVLDRRRNLDQINAELHALCSSHTQKESHAIQD